MVNSRTVDGLYLAPVVQNGLSRGKSSASSRTMWSSLGSLCFPLAIETRTRNTSIKLRDCNSHDQNEGIPVIAG